MNWLKQQALAQPNQLFINGLTVQEVDEQATQLAKKIASYVKDKSRVAIYSTNSVEMALFFFALQYLGKEVLMLNTRLTEEERNHQLATLGIDVVFSYDDTFISFEEVKHSELEEEIEIDDFDLERVAVIMNTSATTGTFKSVPITWKQFDHHVKASKASLGVTEKDNWLLVLPMYHIGGLNILLRSLYNGTQVTIMERFDEQAMAQLIEQGTVNMVSVVPTMLNRIIDGIESHRLRVVLVGGEFIPKALVEKCIAKQVPIFKTYGMTETCSQSTTFSVLDYPEKIDSVGQPLEGVKIQIHDRDDHGAGEIWLQSPMLMEGYLGREPIEGYFNTEDIGYLDEEGFLYILDRRKNIIISGGENIYPKEIENALYHHPEVKECAVIGRQDKVWGQVPILYVVSILDKEELMQYLSKRIAKYKLPKEVNFLAELPKSPIGKILKKDLR